MALIKTKEEIDILREGGRRLSGVLTAVAKTIKPGVTTGELDALAERLIREEGDVPAFLNYQPDGASIPFPASLCVSVNDEIVHGIPSTERVLVEGDIVGIDLGLVHRGLITDMAVTVPVGKISKGDEDLMIATKRSLNAAVAAVKDGAHVGDIGAAIEESVEASSGKEKDKYKIVLGLGGHGVGHEVHEPPFIANVGAKGTGEELKEGMVIAIEPMLALGSDDIKMAKDRFTFITADGSKSAHYELTLAVGKNGADILTPPVKIG